LINSLYVYAEQNSILPTIVLWGLMIDKVDLVEFNWKFFCYRLSHMMVRYSTEQNSQNILQHLRGSSSIIEKFLNFLESEPKNS
jgi:hypothetical protein